jgi:hypothetical protein
LLNAAFIYSYTVLGKISEKLYTMINVSVSNIKLHRDPEKGIK